MSTSKEQYAGKAKMKEAPENPLRFKLKDKIIKNKHLNDRSVDARVIDNGAVTPEKVSSNFIQTLVEPLISSLRQQMINSISSLDAKYRGITNELYSMVRSLQVGGLALSNRLGNREDIGITQKEITDVINSIEARLNDITGEYIGLYMTVTPTTFIAEGSGTVNITATAAIGEFDKIEFYLNGAWVAGNDHVSSYSASVEISETSMLECRAWIFGVEYTKTQLIIKYFPFFLGFGANLEDALRPENAREYDGSIVGTYDMTANAGDKIFMLVTPSIQTEFIRLDMNGYEIPFTVEQEGELVIWESENTYQAGEYNIDITDNNN